MIQEYSFLLLWTCYILHSGCSRQYADGNLERGVKEVVGTLIVEFGSFGKAPLVEQVSLEEMAERYRKAGI